MLSQPRGSIHFIGFCKPYPYQSTPTGVLNLPLSANGSNPKYLPTEGRYHRFQL